MSVQVLRIILLIAVAACVKIMYKCKIASPGVAYLTVYCVRKPSIDEKQVV